METIMEMNANTNANEFIKVINDNITAGTFGLSIVTQTEPKMNKKNNPYFGRVQKLNLQHGVQLGVSYKSQCENRQEKSGSERGYEVAPQKGTHYFDRFFNQSDKDENQFYLRVGYRANSDCKLVIYFVDGKEATAEQIDEIKNFIPQPSVCLKQMESGITQENEVKWRTIKTQNILAVWQGDNVVYGEKKAVLAEYISAE